MNKTENLITAIQEINDISKHLEKLLDDIRGLDSPKEVAIEDKLNVSLEFVLNSGPEIIRNSTDKAYKLIEEIRETLF